MIIEFLTYSTQPQCEKCKIFLPLRKLREINVVKSRPLKTTTFVWWTFKTDHIVPLILISRKMWLTEKFSNFHIVLSRNVTFCPGSSMMMLARAAFFLSVTNCKKLIALQKSQKRTSFSILWFFVKLLMTFFVCKRWNDKALFFVFFVKI